MAKNRRRRIGILTGGGDCPGLNAAIRAVVRSGIRDHKMEVLGILEGFKGLLEMNTMPLAYDDVANILTLGGTILGTSRENPFKARRRQRGKEIVEDRSDVVVENYRKLKLDALICIGGDGTHRKAHKLAQKGLEVVGIPKTIDHDLPGTDGTIGFDSCLAVATESIDRLHSTAASHHRIMVIEVMGNRAGWLALTAGIAGGGDVILIPEIRYNPETVSHFLLERRRAVELVERRLRRRSRWQGRSRCGQADPRPHRSRDAGDGARLCPARRTPDPLRSHPGHPLRNSGRRAHCSRAVRTHGVPPG
jgi:6-phosphofructokinase